ncbi:AsmA family protein [Roseomonas sp. CCTCC AB2023176]|uniref:AsmA family protein n=1 Tax=Roseomonas sp. CCTCC AB2023176 TaxID=3342640 RepID=UPI0035D6BF55
MEARVMAERRRVPRWAIWLGIPILAIALLVAFWDWDWFIPLAERQASAALGRKVTIEHLQVRLGRVTTVSALGIRVANPEGWPDDPPFARAPRLTVRADVMAYVRDRRVVIPSIEVERPQVEALARDDGSNNYTFDLGGEGPKGEGAAPAEPGEGRTRIGLLRVIDGAAHVRIPNLQADFNLAVATRDEAGPDPRIAVRADGTYAGQRITGEAMGGAVLALQDTGKPWPIEINLANGDTRVSVRGTLSNPLELAGANVRAELRGPDMARLQPLSGVPFPETPPFQVAGQVDYAGGRIRFRDFEGRVGQSDLSGTISVTPTQGKPDVVAELHSRRVDLADLGGFIGEEPGSRNTPGQTPQQRQQQARNQANPRVLPNDPINLPKLDAANVRLTYRADSIVGRRVPFDNMRAEMELRDGNLVLRPLALGVGRGTLEGNITLQPREGNALHAVAEVQFRNLDVSRLVGAAGVEGAGGLTGRGRVEGTGNSFAAIAGNGNGALTVGMSGGNLSSLLVDLSGLRLGNALLSTIRLPGRTQVQCFVGDFVLGNGTVTTRALVLDTEDVLILGNATVNLRNEALGLRLRSESKTFTVGALPTDIIVTGTFRDQNVGVDVEELAARGGIAGALGALVAPAAGLLPTIQFGIGEDDRCENLRRNGGRARSGGQPGQQTGRR